MRLTNKRICREIEKVTGDSVNLYFAEDMWFFGSDDEEVQAKLNECSSVGVYVLRLNHLTLDRWVEQYQSILEKAA